jgi:hypothetical protein
VVSRELRGEMAILRADLLSEMDRRFAEQTRQLVCTIVASNATLVGLVLAAVRLG